MVGLKFFICGVVGQFLWLTFLSALSSSSVPEPEPIAVHRIPTDTLVLLLILVLPSLVAAAIYLHLPSETVDWYHKFGKSSMLFFGLNISLSALFVWYEFTFKTNLVTHSSASLEAIGSWVLASVFLPGLCIGTFVATRWAK